MNETPEQRAVRKAGRTGKAFGRAEFVASRMGDFDLGALTDAFAAYIGAIPALAPLLTSGFPISDTLRWVPVGPSTVRNGTGEFYRRESGRIKDIQVHQDGLRAYAATATGGVWYTEDGGATWAPIGGWANRKRAAGGANNAQSCGTIMVHFGGTPADDFVMVGTGMGDLVWNRTPNRPALGGVGILAAANPAVTAGVGGDPWEVESGIGVLEGKGTFRLARQPGVTPGRDTGPDADRVAAATNQGLFIGERQPGPPGASKFVWTEKTNLDTFLGLSPGSKPVVTDALWLPKGANGRLVIAVCLALSTVTTPAASGAGVAYSDDNGSNFHWVSGLDIPTMAPAAAGRMSLAHADGGRIYVLGDLVTGVPGNISALWQVADVTGATPTATRITTGMRPDLWNPPGGGNQRDWDQCIVVDFDPARSNTDRLYLGGSFVNRGTKLPASIWCFDVTSALALVPAPGISTAGPPPGQGASPAGMIGDNVHADVQRIQLSGAPSNRTVWVTCDGGVYVSAQGGRVNTFQSRANGLAALEVNFVATHPTSSHYLAIGTQDNGRHMRIGDTVWEETSSGDGGGVAFHPVHSVFVVSQTTNAGWSCTPATGFTHPLSRALGSAAASREDNLSAFYTGVGTAIRSGAGRLSLGTNRVWLTDDLGAMATNSWNVLPYPSGAATDPRPGGTDPVGTQTVGVPGGGVLAAAASMPLGKILTQKWAKPGELLVLFEKGLVRWVQASGGTWTSRILVAPSGVALAPAVTGAPDPGRTNLSDIGPVPGTSDFYLTTTGDRALPPNDTCFFFDDASSTFRPTDLRTQLTELDPAYAVVVNPAKPEIVYVGTVTGVWSGQRTLGVAAHKWDALPNGLPQAVIQDLSIFQDTGTNTLLLRAAIQARGVWELDIGNGVEPQRTYLKVHLRDDRRRLPVPMDNPRNDPGIARAPAFASPDIVIRPRSNPATAPGWQLGSNTIRAGNAPPYQLWTFQTAFRWHFPSVVPDGVWTDALGELILLYRNTFSISPAIPEIDQALWNSVVGGTHLDSSNRVTTTSTDPLAVYRTPWSTAAAPATIPTEIDILGSVVVQSSPGGVQRVFNEPSTVDILLHHRDTRPVKRNEAFAILLWRHAASQAGALSPATISGIPGYVASVLTAEGVPSGTPSALPADPSGWTLARNAAGRALHTLDADLDARMPRAVSIDVDLSVGAAIPVPDGHHVLFLAIAGSKVDPCSAAVTGTVTTMADLVRRWPYAAMRLVRANVR